MKKFLQNIGVFILVGFSFFYTEKITYVINDKDDIMVKLKEKDYNIQPIEPIILEDTIIPGLGGKKINIKKSYQKMKQYGMYNENLIQYSTTLPNQMLEENKDKYIISGNSKKNMISLMFYLDENSKLDMILNILEKNNLKGTFFINEKWLETNGNEIYKLKNHTVGNGSREYGSSDFIWINTTIQNLLNKSDNYCYFIEKNKEQQKSCYIQNNYSIIPNIVVEKDLYQDVVTNVQSGNLILINVNQNIINELNNTIIYLKSKGYILVDLKTHLEI